MINKDILGALIKKKNVGKKSFAVLIDPDNIGDDTSCVDLVKRSGENGVDYFFVGGSLITTNNLNRTLKLVKAHSTTPIVLFPGSNMHIDASADAILFLSLLSGRNPELLIGQHVVAAPILKNSGLEILPTGYILVHSGQQTTVSYMSNTTPIPRDKTPVAVCTALAGEMLGLRLIYLDAGSGAKNPVPPEMIASVRETIDAPLLIGGGIDSADKAEKAIEAGADVVVVGNGIEKNPNVLIEVSRKIKAYNDVLNVH